MNALSHCTLTGVDDATDLGRVAELMDEYPFAEFGVLWSQTRAGERRYPSKTRLEAIARRFHGGRIALHVCGRAVADFVVCNAAAPAVAASFPRVQLNARFTPTEAWEEAFDAMLAVRQGVVITQHNEANAPFSTMFPRRANHAILRDASCGRGVAPDVWPTPLPGKLCGYAGGLGPNEIDAALPAIAAAADGAQFWIDMESKLRVDDVLDLDACATVLRKVAAWRTAQAGVALTPGDAQARLGRLLHNPLHEARDLRAGELEALARDAQAAGRPADGVAWFETLRRIAGDPLPQG